MTAPALQITKGLLQACLSWFEVHFRQWVETPLTEQFPNYRLPSEVQSVIKCCQGLRQLFENPQSDLIDIGRFFTDQSAGAPGNPPLFKQMILRYRRHVAARAEELREKTFHAALIQTLDEEINAWDAVAEADWFQKIGSVRLPRSKDFLPVQYIEQSAFGQTELAPRQYDEKFHILQTPALFLPDLAYFRGKCEVRDAPLTIAFLDIDDFKRFNTAHGETKVDRNLLPRFMQTVEARVYHHGFAYRQGGDEYLILFPSLSRSIAIELLDELRRDLAKLTYAEVDGTATVSIGVCIAEPDCPLTDRELRDRANQAKKFAKDKGKNCIATFEGSRFVLGELRVVRPHKEATVHRNKSAETEQPS